MRRRPISDCCIQDERTLGRTGTVGFAGTVGNAETLTFTTGINADRETNTDKTSLYFSLIKASASSITKARIPLKRSVAESAMVMMSVRACSSAPSTIMNTTGFKIWTCVRHRAASVSTHINQNGAAWTFLPVRRTTVQFQHAFCPESAEYIGRRIFSKLARPHPCSELPDVQ